MNGSLARLLAFWVNNNGKVNERELVTLLLETVRDDIVQAQTKDGKEVADPHDVQDYLNEQIAELRGLDQKPSGSSVQEVSVCKRCSSDKQRKFRTEMNIHFPGYEGLTKPTMLVFPEIVVCLDCGLAEFSVPEAELRRLAEKVA